MRSQPSLTFSAARICRLSLDANGATSNANGAESHRNYNISNDAKGGTEECSIRHADFSVSVNFVTTQDRLRRFFWSPLQLYGEQLIEETLIYAFRPLYVKSGMKHALVPVQMRSTLS